MQSRSRCLVFVYFCSQISSILMRNRLRIFSDWMQSLIASTRSMELKIIVLGSQQYPKKDGKGKTNVFANAINHDFKSKNPKSR